jgi:hypothetical protein
MEEVPMAAFAATVDEASTFEAGDDLSNFRRHRSRLSLA